MAAHESSCAVWRAEGLDPARCTCGMRPANLRVRVVMKDTRETFVVFWCSESGGSIWMKTGTVDINAGVERNDRGDVVRQWPRFITCVGF